MKKFILYNGTNNGPYKKPFSRDWKELKKWLEAKLLNLHIEETAFQKRKKKSPEEVDSWMQQLGKMVFISGTLTLFFGKNKIADTVWKERGWQEKDGKIIIKKDGNKKHKS